MSNFWTTIFWTIFGTLWVHFPLEFLQWSTLRFEIYFSWKNAVSSSLIAIWIKNDGDFRWFMLLCCNWHLKSSCIKESKTNIIERINICSLNSIKLNVFFCNENIKKSTQRKERASLGNLCTFRCQINESTRLSFSDFFPPYSHFFHYSISKFSTLLIFRHCFSRFSLI